MRLATQPLSFATAFNPQCNCRTKLRYRICKVQTAASAVGCGWMWSEKLNKRKSDGGMTGDVLKLYTDI